MIWVRSAVKPEELRRSAWLRLAAQAAVVVALMCLAVANIASRMTWSELEDGVLWQMEAGSVTAGVVHEGSPAERAGIRPGDVLFEEQTVTRRPMHPRARLGMGYLTQKPSLLRKLTVEQNILAILETCRINSTECKLRLKYLLDELDLTPLAKSKAYTLSGGEKRRLEITRALVTSPRLLLLDEPFAGIDPLAVYEVQKIVRRLKERGLGILITDHNARETLKLVDRAYIIVRGEVMCEGDSEFLANDPKAREIYLGPEFNM